MSLRSPTTLTPRVRDAAHTRVVVEQRDRDVRTFGIVEHRGDGRPATATGAEDDDALAPAVLQGPPELTVVIHAPPEPHRDHDEHRHGAAGEDGRDRQRAVVHDRAVDDEQTDAGDEERLRDRADFLDRSEHPLAAVETEERSRRELRDDDERNERDQPPPFEAARTQAQYGAQNERPGPRGGVDHRLRDTASMRRTSCHSPQEPCYHSVPPTPVTGRFWNMTSPAASVWRKNLPVPNRSLGL